MSNLPHQNLDTSPGDLFYPGSPTVTVADVPGAGGSRAVEFGEDGYSLAVNRMGYALGKNDEYQQARLEAPIAKPDFTTFVPAGGNGASFQFSAIDMFVGDATYLPESQAVRDSLISVLDGNYNDLLANDGTKVVVKELKNAADTASIVGDTVPSGGDANGFYALGAIAKFQTVHPTTGVVVTPIYVIPDATGVIFAHGIAGTIDSLATPGQEHLMRDALVKGVIRGISEIHAGTFLTDGSRAAIGHFNMDGLNIEAIGTLSGLDGNPLTIIGLNSKIIFEDDWTTFDLNNGQTALQGDTSPKSLLSELNSRTQLDGALYGEITCRFTFAEDPLTFNPATGEVSYPEMQYVRAGELRTLAAGSEFATDAVNTVLVIDNTGTVVERAWSAVVAGDLPIAHYEWDSGGAAFDIQVDIRWRMHALPKAFEITCGDDPGTDFGIYGLQDAVDLASVYAASDSAGSGPTTVRIKGTCRNTDLGTIYVRGSISIRGDCRTNSKIFTDTNNDAVHDFDFLTNTVVLEDLTIINSSDVKAANVAGFFNAGNQSIFRDLIIDKDVGTFDAGFHDVWGWDMGAGGVLFHNILVTCEPARSLINGADVTFANRYLVNCQVDSVAVQGWGASASAGIIMPGLGNQITRFFCNPGLNQYGVVVGNRSVVEDSNIRMTSVVDSIAVAILPTSSTPYGSKAQIRNCYFEDCEYGVVCSINDVTARVVLSLRDTEIENCVKALELSGMVLSDPDSTVKMSGCTVIGCTDTIVDNPKIIRFYFERNTCYNITGDGVVIGADAGGFIESNFIEGYGSGGTHENAIHVVYGLLFFNVHIRGNNLAAAGADPGSAVIEIGRTCLIEGNTITGAVQYGILTQPADTFFFPRAVNNTIAENTITGQTWGIRIASSVEFIYNGSRINGNRFGEHPQNGGGVWIDDGANVMVGDNDFTSILGVGVQITGSFAGGSNNCQVKGNFFNNVKGERTGGGDKSIIIWVNAVAVGSALAAMISDNHFSACGTTNAGLMTGNSQSIIFISLNAEAYVVQNNVIHGLTGVSSAGNNSDFTHGIKVAESGKIQGNMIYKDFGVAGAVANYMAGITVGTTGVQVMGNYLYFTGTQLDANKSSDVTGIECSTNDRCMVVGNYVDQWVVALATLIAINANGDNVVFVGNYGRNEDGFVTGADGIVVGNAWPGGGSLSWGGGGTNKPSAGAYSGNGALPYQDMNVNAVSHA